MYSILANTFLANSTRFVTIIKISVKRQNIKFWKFHIGGQICTKASWLGSRV